MNCILLGDKSDIAKGLIPYLERDGWTVHGWSRDRTLPEIPSWDLMLCALGRVAPVGHWAEQDGRAFFDCVQSNLLQPIKLLRNIWHKRNPSSIVCFMGGSNPQKIMPGYLPYNLSKMALLKAIEQIDAESPDCTVFALGPGYVKTKIHKPTLDANWPNERIARGDAGTPIEKIYETLKWCLAQDKSVVGGRNVCASDPIGPQLALHLEANPSMFKLRRVE